MCYQVLRLTMNTRLWRADSKADAASRFGALSLRTVGVQSAHSSDLETCKCVASHSNTSSPSNLPLSFPFFLSLSLLLFPPATFSFGSLEAQPSLVPAIYLGTTSAKMGQGRPSFSSVSSSLTLLLSTRLCYLVVRLTARTTCSPIRQAPVGAGGPCSASVTRLGPFLLC